MAVEALCPICGAVFSLRDDMQGKKVRCTKCEQVFTVGGGAKAKPAGEKQSVQPKPSAPAKKSAARDDDDEVSSAKKNRAAARRSRDDDDDDDRPRAKASARRGKDDDDDDDRKAKAKKKRVFHDEDDDEDDTPRKPARKSSGGAGMMLGIIGGVVALLLLVCGGISYGIYHWVHSTAEDLQGQIANNANNPNPNPGFPNLGNPGPGQNPLKPAKTLASVDDALRDLKSDNQRERRPALDWLAKAKLDRGRRAEVARAVNPFLKDPDGGTREAAVNALKVWGTKENVPGLVQILNETAPGLLPGYAYGAIEVLGMLQDERGAEPVWKFRDGAFTWVNADKALKAMGQAAGEKAALNHLDDQNRNLRDGARSLVVYYGTKDALKVEQAAADLKSGNKDKRWAAAEYLTAIPVVESERPAVSVALNLTLLDAEGGVVENGIRAMDRWYTKDNVLPLAKALGDDRFPRRREALALLGKLKDVRAAAAVAARLPNGGERRQAGDALIAMGPGAKDEVMKYLNHPDTGTRNEAKRVLASYGNAGNLDLTERLGDLKGTDKRKRGDAARWFQTAAVDEGKRAEVSKALVAVVEDLTDRGVQEQAIRAMGTWGTRNDLGALVKVVEGADQHVNSKNAAIDVLVKLKDERVVKPLAVRLLDPRERGNAAKHLIALGPGHGVAIENEVAAGLAAPDKGLKIECAKILGAVGTKASITPLNNAAKVARLARPMQRDVAQQCANAIAAIAARGK